MNEQEQFEEWFANDTKGFDKASARAGWVERMANESAEIAQLREERDSQQRVCIQVMEERDALRAQIEAAQKQEPIAKVTGAGWSGIESTNPKTEWLEISVITMPLTGVIELGTRLYAAPVPARVVMPGEDWRDMDSAPKDGTLIRLLVRFSDNSTEDAEEAPTIGANYFDNNDIDEWFFAGWSWEFDCFTAGKGEPLGWLPLLNGLNTKGDV